MISLDYSSIASLHYLLLILSINRETAGNVKRSSDKKNCEEN